MSKVVILALLFLFSMSAEARWKPEYAQQYTPQERQWFRDQKIPGTNFSCCSTADGEIVEEDIRDGHYWIRCPLDGACPFKEWTRVPDERVITEPNKFGRAVVWFRNYPVGTSSIICFAPGAGI